MPENLRRSPGRRPRRPLSRVMHRPGEPTGTARMTPAHGAAHDLDGGPGVTPSPVRRRPPRRVGRSRPPQDGRRDRHVVGVRARHPRAGRLLDHVGGTAVSPPAARSPPAPSSPRAPRPSSGDGDDRACVRRRRRGWRPGSGHLVGHGHPPASPPRRTLRRSGSRSSARRRPHRGGRRTEPSAPSPTQSQGHGRRSRRRGVPKRLAHQSVTGMAVEVVGI